LESRTGACVGRKGQEQTETEESTDDLWCVQKHVSTSSCSADSSGVLAGSSRVSQLTPSPVSLCSSPFTRDRPGEKGESITRRLARRSRVVQSGFDSCRAECTLDLHSVVCLTGRGELSRRSPPRRYLQLRPLQMRQLRTDWKVDGPIPSLGGRSKPANRGHQKSGQQIWLSDTY